MPTNSPKGPNVSAGTAHIPALDGVRALAVLAVFCFHYGGGASSHIRAMRVFGMLCSAGWAGVPLFFVLSGFLITGILWDTKGSSGWLKNFYARRSLRIFPLYYFALLLNLVIAAYLHRAAVMIHYGWIYVLYLQDCPPFQNASAIVAPPLPLFHFWSLAVEEQFYLVWPFLLLWTRTRRGVKALCLGGIAFSLLFRLLSLRWGGVPVWGGFLLSHTGELCSGAWLAMQVRETKARGILWTSVLVVATAALLGLVAMRRTISSNDPWIYTLGLLLLPAIFVSLIAKVLQGRSVSAAFAPAPLRWVGRVSYGVYVYHAMLIVDISQLISRWMNGYGAGVQAGSRFLLALAVTLTVSAASYTFMERPFLKLKDHFQTTVRRVAA